MPGLLVLWVGVAINIDLAPALTWHDGQRLAQLVFFLLMVVLLAMLPGLRRQSLLAWAGLPAAVRIALGLAFGLGLCSALLASLPRWALLDWGLHGLWLVTAMAVAGQSRDPATGLNRLLVMAFLALATAYATSSFAVYLASLLVGPNYGVGFNVRELYTGFSNLRFFGQVETMLLPFLLLPAMWWGRSRVRLVLLWLVPAYWWMLAVGSGTRGTWVALLVGILAAVLFGGAAGRIWLRWQAGGLLAGLACYAVLILGIPLLVDVPTTFMHRADDILSLSRREDLWSASVMLALQHPVLGVGPMQFALHATEVGAHPHNAVLQWAAEWGLPAALAFTLVFAYGGLSFAAGPASHVPARRITREALVRVALLAARGRRRGAGDGRRCAGDAGQPDAAGAALRLGPGHAAVDAGAVRDWRPAARARRAVPVGGGVDDSIRRGTGTRAHRGPTEGLSRALSRRPCIVATILGARSARPVTCRAVLLRRRCPDCPRRR